MRVLVTGASGRLGRIFRLHSAGRADTFYVRHRTGSPQAGDISLDLTDGRAVSALIESLRPDSILHLAAVSGTRTETDPESARIANVVATRNLAIAAAAAGTRRIVFASSAAIYGDAYKAPVSEITPPNPRSIYAETKLAAEQTLSAIADDHGFSAIALRIFNIFGDGFDDSLIWKLRNSSPGNPVLLRGWDSFVRDYSDADAIVSSFAAALELPGDDLRTLYNIGSGVETSNRSLVSILERDGPVYYTVVAGPHSYSCADITRARRELGIDPLPLR